MQHDKSRPRASAPEQGTSPIFFVEQGTPGWERMWKALAEAGWVTPGPPPCPTCSPSGECWQYMGSQRLDSGIQVHDFRHREYPRKTGMPRVYVSLRMQNAVLVQDSKLASFVERLTYPGQGTLERVERLQ